MIRKYHNLTPQTNPRHHEVESQNNYIYIKKSKEKETKIRNRYNQIIHPVRDTIWESDKTQGDITHKRAKRSVFSQATKNRQDRLIKTDVKKTAKRIHKRSTALERSVKKSPEDLGMFNGANLTLILMWIKTINIKQPALFHNQCT